MNFIEAVQQSKIKQPTQFGYSPQKWTDGFNIYQTGSDDEHRLFNAGLWFFDQLDNIRKKLKEYPDALLENQILRRIYVGFVNREYTVITGAVEQDAASKKGDEVFAGNLIEKRLPIGQGGYSVHVRGTVESMITALRYPLSEVFRSNSDGTENKYSDLEILRIIGIRSNLGILYDELSDFWSECLWNGWSVTIDSKCDYITPPQSNEYISRIISEHRDDTLTLELTFRAIWLWKSLPSDLKDAELKRLRAVDIARNKNKRKIKLGKIKDSPIPPAPFLVRIAAEELYWNDILLQPLPKLNNLTIRDILSIWDVLASLGEILKSKLPNDIGIKKVNQLVAFAPKISKTQLVRAIIKATGFNSSKVSLALNLFVFTGDVRNDPWFKPIVPISENEYSFIIPPLTVPNLIRSIESWMKEGGLDLGERGQSFENFVRSELLDSLRESKYLSKTIINDRSLKIGTGQNSEEIDLVSMIGHTVIVGEIKPGWAPQNTPPTSLFHPLKKN